VALAMPAHAENKINLSATAAFTTDYVFRGITQTAENPAAQPEFDLTYGIFYAGIWGSNLDFGGSPFSSDIASIEIDYYAGLTPMWKGITFNIGGIYYTYPGAFDPGTEFDYFELKTGASYTFAKKLTPCAARKLVSPTNGRLNSPARRAMPTLSSCRPPMPSAARSSTSSRPASAA
jgi:uncharacterized protein (TIGR02001 family)